MVPNNIKFTEDHEWALLDKETATIGISAHAAEELGEIVFAELSDIGSTVDKSDEVGTIESVKTVSNIYSPLSGEIIEVNQKAIENPSLISDSPFEEGWLFKIRLADDSEYESMMSSERYEEFLELA